MTRYEVTSKRTGASTASRTGSFLDVFPDVGVGYISLEYIVSGFGDFGDRLYGT